MPIFAHLIFRFWYHKDETQFRSIGAVLLSDTGESNPQVPNLHCLGKCSIKMCAISGGFTAKKISQHISVSGRKVEFGSFISTSLPLASTR